MPPPGYDDLDSFRVKGGGPLPSALCRPPSAVCRLQPQWCAAATSSFAFFTSAMILSWLVFGTSS
jgi:hypothetical protein